MAVRHCGDCWSTKRVWNVISSLRATTNNWYVGDRDAGWHLSWMGDSDRRKTKLRNIAEYYIWDKPEVQKLCDDFVPKEGNTDMLGREDHLITSYPVSKLPEAALRIESECPMAELPLTKLTVKKKRSDK